MRSRSAPWVPRRRSSQLWVLKTAHGPVKYARGILDQYIIAVPEKHRVIVRLGMKRGTNIHHHPKEVRALIDWALS